MLTQSGHPRLAEVAIPRALFVENLRLKGRSAALLLKTPSPRASRPPPRRYTGCLLPSRLLGHGPVTDPSPVSAKAYDGMTADQLDDCLFDLLQADAC